MEDVYICLCNAVRQSTIENAIERGVNTLEGLQEELEVAVNCCACEPEVIQLLKVRNL